MAAPDHASGFWQFSLRFYRRPEVPRLCLALQDEQGVDVNCLFYLLFLATHGRALSADEVRRIDNAVVAWRNQVVQPLRGVRRAMKESVAPIDANEAHALRAAIKRDELQAERLQQEAMERAFPVPAIGVSTPPRDAARANIAAYGAVTGALPQATIDALLNALAGEYSL